MRAANSAVDTSSEPIARMPIAVPGRTYCATSPPSVAPTACIASSPEPKSPNAWPCNGSGVVASSRSCSSSVALYPMDATPASTAATGSGGSKKNTRNGAASSHRSGPLSRNRSRFGTNRPASASPASIPIAADTNSTLAARGE